MIDEQRGDDAADLTPTARHEAVEQESSFVRECVSPVLPGNVAGGVALVAAVNHAQVSSGS